MAAGREMRFKAVLSDEVSKGIDAIGKKLAELNGRVVQQAKNQEGAWERYLRGLAAAEERASKQRIALQRSSIAAEESLRAKTQADYERWWQRQFAIADRAEKAKTAKQEQEERQRIALQRNSLALAEAQQAREAQRSLQNTKYLQDSALRIERQAAIAEASLILDRFDRRIAIERTKHAQILTDLKGNDAAIENEKRRHQAVIGRIEMDKANFPNTPFQKMLESFNKLNMGLGKAAPILTTAASQVGAMSGTLGTAASAVNGFGGALMSFTMGPAGIAIAAVTALSAGINAMIDAADQAATTRADLGSTLKDPAKVKEMLGVWEQYRKARAMPSQPQHIGMGVYRDARADAIAKANSDWRKLAGVAIEDEKIFTEDILRVQEKAAAKTTQQAKDAREAAKKAQGERWDWERQVRESDQRNAEAAARVAQREADRIRKIHEDDQKTAEIYAKREAERQERNRKASMGLKVAQAGSDPVAKLKVEHEAELEEARAHGDDLTAILARQEIERTEAVRKQSEERTRINRAERDAMVAAGVGAVNAIGEALVVLAGKNRGLAKAGLRITEAGAIASTAAGVMKAYEQGGILGFLTGTAIAAEGVKQVATIEAQLSKFATGTDYAPGGMALVGEQGPEMVYLPRGSKVKTAPETQRMAGGSSIHAPITINMAPGSTQADADRVAVTVGNHLRRMRESEREAAYLGYRA